MIREITFLDEWDDEEEFDDEDIEEED